MKSKEAPLFLVNVQIELFGMARIISGRSLISVRVPEHATSGDLAGALAKMHPELINKVILEDQSGFQANYTLNLNGTSFVRDDALMLKSADRVLLFSSQAGG